LVSNGSKAVRALRDRVNATPVQSGREAIHGAITRYLEARQLSWEAYVAALRSPDDAAARPHLDRHREKSAEANLEAQALGRMLRDQRL